MKPVIFAVLLLLLVSQTEALKCHCGGKRQCSSSIETCTGSQDVCIRAIYHPPMSGYFKGCYREMDCWTLNQSPLISAACCKRDLCN